jgi:acyl-coenzyme A thioesterase PaaI-like protein
MDENEFQSRAALADATRRLIRATRVSLVDPGQIDESTELIEGPHSQVGLEMIEGFEPTARPGDYFPFSSVVGPLNPIAAPAELEIIDIAELGIEGPTASETGKAVRGRVVLPEQYIGPPWNLTHGGVIAHLFDELLGVATIAGGGGGFTARLTVHYRKPTPALQPLELVGWVESISGRKLVSRGEIRHNGVLTAEADGLFVRVAGQQPGRRVPLAEA